MPSDSRIKSEPPAGSRRRSNAARCEGSIVVEQSSKRSGLVEPHCCATSRAPVTEFRATPAINAVPAELNRRTQIAIRLMRNQARTQTIQRFTEVSKDRLATLRHRLGIHSEARFRGPSPYSLGQIMRSPHLRDEGAAIATLCAQLGAFRLPSIGCSSVANLFTLNTAERLCDAFELFKECFPSAQITLEQTILIAFSLTRDNTLTLAHCPRCYAAQLLDRMGPPHVRCRACGTSVHIAWKATTVQLADLPAPDICRANVRCSKK